MGTGFKLRITIAFIAGFLLLAGHASARGIDARDWTTDGAGAEVRGDRLSLTLPNAISATVRTRDLRELAFKFGENCPLSGEVLIDGEVAKGFTVSDKGGRRELAVRAAVGEHVVRLELEGDQACSRGRTVLESTSFREFVPIGADMGSKYMQGDRPYQDLMAKHLDSVTLGTDMQWAVIEPKQRGVFDFSGAEAVIDFAEENEMQIRGHPLVWRAFLPEWLRKANWTTAEAIEIMRIHIQTIVGRYAGIVDEWDVINEPIAVNGGGLRNNWFMEEIGRQHIGLALQYAQEMDPTAKFFINDYSTETDTRKSDGMLLFVKELLRLGLPLNGVGFQFHTSTDGWPEADQIQENFKRFTDLGLEVQVSEMDVVDKTANPGSDERRKLQSNAFEAAAKACRNEPLCTRFTMWGLTDRYSWLGENKQPLPFDRKLKSKPSWDAITDKLRPKG